MAKTYEGLRADANIIKNEVEAQKNTATRVGKMLVDCIDKMEDVDSTLTNKVENVNKQLAKMQDKLVSGENIKTINGESVLGSGNISTSIDISALFTVGGTMQVGGTDLLTHHLYVRTENYVSNVSVVVGNKEYILEARRRATMTSYDTLGVKAIVSFATGVATCVNVIME